MFSYLARALFVATSIAPAVIAFLFVRKDLSLSDYMLIAGAALLLVLACLGLLTYARNNLEKFPISIESIKSADQQVLAYIAAYLLPVATKDAELRAVAATAALLFFAILFSNTFHFNPVLGLAGFHFYEISASDKVSYILITPRHINNIKTIRKVVHLTDYLVLGLEE